MAGGFEAVSFSPNGEYFACTTPDGRLKIWETATGVLKQEYTPSSHLSATCTCLSWGFIKTNSGSARKKKKRRSDITESASELKLIAMGTSSGNILLYSIAKGELQSQMTGGHTSKVNALCWSDKADSLYSGSSDHHLIEWSIQVGDIKRKWKAGKEKKVTAMCLTEDGTGLITACRSILWWDLETLQILKKFTGHSTEIRNLLYVSYPECSDDSRYLLSSAVDDRVINAWQLKESTQDKNSLASFILSDEPHCIDISRSSSRNQTLLLSVTTKNGLLSVFEFHLNGRCKEPLQPAMNIVVSSSGFENHEKPKPYFIACSQFTQEDNRTIMFTYGTVLHLKFESIPFSSKEKDVCLIRTDPQKTGLEKNSMKIKTPHVNSEVKLLVPAYMVSSKAEKKSEKTPTIPVEELPMEDRLGVLSLEKRSAELPTLSNLNNLLVQGLQSNDEEILTTVLTNDNDSVIINTIQRLPIQTLAPLLKELHKRILNATLPARIYLKWFRCILTIHTSFLVTLPDLDNLIGPLHQILVSHSYLFDKISKLKGRLDVILAQINSKKKGPSSEIPAEALLMYQDDSSDERDSSDDVNDMMFSQSEPELDDGDWDASSDSESDNTDNEEEMETEENNREQSIHDSDENSD